MMMIGLGKHVGALAYHKILLEVPYDGVVRAVANVVRAKAPISFGLALVENSFDETARIEAALPQDFEKVEEELLVLAKQWIGRLPYRDADLLIIDEIGKNISGSGMDTNVVRKRAFRNEKGPDGQPNIRHIFVRGLTEKTHGNAASPRSRSTGDSAAGSPAVSAPRRTAQNKPPIPSITTSVIAGKVAVSHAAFLYLF